MIQKQQWLTHTNVLITDEMNQGSIQVEIPHADSAHQRKNATITHLWVNHPCRQRHVATHLLRQAETIAVLYDCPAVNLCWTRGEAQDWVWKWYMRQGYTLLRENKTDYWYRKNLDEPIP